MVSSGVEDVVLLKVLPPLGQVVEALLDDVMLNLLLDGVVLILGLAKQESLPPNGRGLRC